MIVFTFPAWPIDQFILLPEGLKLGRRQDFLDSLLPQIPVCNLLTAAGKDLPVVTAAKVLYVQPGHSHGAGLTISWRHQHGRRIRIDLPELLKKRQRSLRRHRPFVGGT
jgi:hypothetical protein